MTGAPYLITGRTMVANRQEEIRGDTRFVALVSASVDESDIEVSINDNGFQPLYLGVAIVELKDIARIAIKTGTNQVVKIATGAAMVYDSRAAAGGGSMVMDITKVGGAGIGQKVMAGSLPVAIASDQSTLPVSIAAPVTPYAASAALVRGQTALMAATADVTVIAAPGGGARLHITSLMFYNSHASVATEIAIKDGATELFRIHLRAGTATGSSCPIEMTLPVPIRLSDNTALVAANITTGSATRVMAVGFVGA